MDLSTIVVYTFCFLVATPFVLFLAGFIGFFIYLFWASGWGAAMKLTAWLYNRD